MSTTVTTNNHTISLLVANKPGVLVRISLVFARRGYNIESLVVSPALDGKFSRMTITAEGDKETLEQIIKQTAKLVDVVSATEHKVEEGILEKEMALVKVTCQEGDRTAIFQIVEHFKGLTIDFSEESLIISITGSTEKLNCAISMLKKFGIKELVRTGKILMTRGSAQT